VTTTVVSNPPDLWIHAANADPVDDIMITDDEEDDKDSVAAAAPSTRRKVGLYLLMYLLLTVCFVFLRRVQSDVTKLT